jgi:hypothetical protein
VIIFDQKEGTSLDTACCKDASRGKQSVHGQSVCLSQLYNTIFASGMSGNPPTIIITILLLLFVLLKVLLMGISFSFVILIIDSDSFVILIVV